MKPFLRCSDMRRATASRVKIKLHICRDPLNNSSSRSRSKLDLVDPYWTLQSAKVERAVAANRPHSMPHLPPTAGPTPVFRRGVAGSPELDAVLPRCRYFTKQLSKRGVLAAKGSTSCPASGLRRHDTVPRCHARVASRKCALIGTPSGPASRGAREPMGDEDSSQSAPHRGSLALVTNQPQDRHHSASGAPRTRGSSGGNTGGKPGRPLPARGG